MAGEENWVPAVVFVTLILISTSLSYGYYIWLEKASKKLHDQSLQDGSYVNFFFETLYPDPAISTDTLTMIGPGKERQKNERNVHLSYKLTRDKVAEFFAWAKDQKSEEAAYESTGQPWCQKLYFILQLRKEAVAKVSEQISQMPLNGERYLAVKALYVEHIYLEIAIRDFWSQGWMRYVDIEKDEEVYPDEESELVTLLERSIMRVPEAISYKDWTDKNGKWLCKGWKSLELFGHLVMYAKNNTEAGPARVLYQEVDDHLE